LVSYDAALMKVFRRSIAGVPMIAVLSGGVSRGKLETAGAQAVFENPRDLRDHLDSTAIGTLAKAVQTA